MFGQFVHLAGEFSSVASHELCKIHFPPFHLSGMQSGHHHIHDGEVAFRLDDGREKQFLIDIQRQFGMKKQ